MFFRPDAYVSKSVYVIWDVKDIALAISAAIPRPLYVLLSCYFCDMLWAYALTFTVAIISDDYKARWFYFVSGGFCVLSELAQAVGVMPGTFDIIDVVLEISITALCALIINFYLFKENEK